MLTSIFNQARVFALLCTSTKRSHNSVVSSSLLNSMALNRLTFRWRVSKYHSKRQLSLVLVWFIVLITVLTPFLDPVYFRFHHYIQRNQMVAHAPLNRSRQTWVPVFPNINKKRDLRAPSFYSEMKGFFPLSEAETYIYLPHLFLEPRLLECKNASYKILVSDSGKNLKQNFL